MRYILKVGFDGNEYNSKVLAEGKPFFQKHGIDTCLKSTIHMSDSGLPWVCSSYTDELSYQHNFLKLSAASVVMGSLINIVS